MSMRKGVTGNSKFSATSQKDAGALDEDVFLASFEDVPKVQLFSNRDVEDELQSIKIKMENASLDWEKRVEAMRRLRSVVMQRPESEEVLNVIRTMEGAFSTSIKDLRSKIVREACITMAYLCSKYGTKCERLIEMQLQNMINLIQNSAKIMASSGLVTIRFLIQHAQSPRLLPILLSNMSHKSREIRRAITEFLHQLLITWSTHSLEKHNLLLQKSIKMGIADADAEARSNSRKAFWAYNSHFREQSEHLLHSLDAAKQKMLLGEQLANGNGLSSSLSTNSLPGTTSRSSSSSSIARTAASSGRQLPPVMRSIGTKSGIPIISPARNCIRGSPMRTASAIDIGAARAAALRIKGRNDLPIVPKKPVLGTPVQAETRQSRSKSRVSQSTPSSRSTSPTSKFSYLTNLQPRPLNPTLCGSNSAISGQRRRSGIPLLTSRESSPTRTLERRLSSSKLHKFESGKENNEKLQHSTISPSVLHQNDFVDAFNSLMHSNRANRRASDDQSDESETSSICSDMSFTSNGRTMEDASEIIRNLSSAHWSDRKEGLLGLQYFLRHSSHTFNSEELKKITDIFTKMLVDPHTKTFSFFLEFLGEYLTIYKHELRHWLFILLTRLFLKAGTDILGSVQSKISRTLDIIQKQFSHQDQFNAIIRFLNDQTQTPTIKTKVIILNYFHNLLNKMSSDEWVLSSGNDFKISLMKIISWTEDPKSMDLRKMAQEVLIDLFNLNTIEYLNVLKQLPNYYQDTACQLTQPKRRFSDGREMNGSSMIFSPIKPKSTNGVRINKQEGMEMDNSENLNPEQVYNSLKKTTDEIQKYISSMGNDNVLNQFAGHENMMSNEKSTESLMSDTLTEHTNGFLAENVETKFKRVFDVLKLEANSSEDAQKQAYNNLVELINTCSEEEWSQHFKDTLSLILDKISKESNCIIRAYSLKIMCELLYKRSKFFCHFIELTMLRILEASKDKEKEVQRAGELCGATAAAVLPGDQSIRILMAVIANSGMPVNLAAIKMLTKVIEKQTNRVVSPLLTDIMPTLIQAYDDIESAIRKAAVFCMVAIHNCVGEEMNQYLTSLNGSKMKLLRLYIDRSKSGSSGTSSPVSVSLKSTGK